LSFHVFPHNTSNKLKALEADPDFRGLPASAPAAPSSPDQQDHSSQVGLHFGRLEWELYTRGLSLMEASSSREQCIALLVIDPAPPLTNSTKPSSP
jgi:hypothetical protein